MRKARDEEAAKYQVIIEENAVKAEMRVEEQENIIKKKNEYIEAAERRLVVKDEEIKDLTELVVQLKERALSDQHTIDEITEELKKHTDPTFQLLENPIVLQQLDTAVELACVSNEKKKLELQKVDSDALMAEQQELIAKLTNITHDLKGTVTPQSSNGPVSRAQKARGYVANIVPEVICLEDEMPGATADLDTATTSREPNSLTRRIKERTTFNERAPKNLSPFEVYGPGTLARCGSTSCSAKQITPNAPKHVLIFDEKYLAMSKTIGVIRHALQKAWAVNGPKSVLWKGSIPMSTVSTGEIVVVLKHEKASASLINAWCDYLLHEVKHNDRSTKTHIFTARFLMYLKQYPNPNREKFLDAVFINVLADILDAEILVFPLNISGSIVEGNKLSDHWVLLKYVRVSGEWHVYNPMEMEADLELESNQDLLQLVVDYTEQQMRAYIERTGKRHPIERRPEGKLISKRCPQIIQGTFDDAIVVCSLVEKTLRRDYNMTPCFTNEMSGRYRSKMAQCFVKKDEGTKV